MADDDDIALHGLDVLSRVQKRLALNHAARGGGDIDHIGGEPFAGKLEGCPRPCARLVEEVDDRLAAKGGHLLDVPFRHVLERRSGVQDELDLIRRHSFDAEQVF